MRVYRCCSISSRACEFSLSSTSRLICRLSSTASSAHRLNSSCSSCLRPRIILQPSCSVWARMKVRVVVLAAPFFFDSLCREQVSGAFARLYHSLNACHCIHWSHLCSSLCCLFLLVPGLCFASLCPCGRSYPPLLSVFYQAALTLVHLDTKHTQSVTPSAWNLGHTNTRSVWSSGMTGRICL